MNRQGLRCTTTTFNIFLDACSKNGDTIRATGAMEQIRPDSWYTPHPFLSSFSPSPGLGQEELLQSLSLCYGLL